MEDTSTLLYITTLSSLFSIIKTLSNSFLPFTMKKHFQFSFIILIIFTVLMLGLSLHLELFQYMTHHRCRNYSLQNKLIIYTISIIFKISTHICCRIWCQILFVQYKMSQYHVQHFHCEIHTIIIPNKLIPKIFQKLSNTVRLYGLNIL